MINGALFNQTLVEHTVVNVPMVTVHYVSTFICPLHLPPLTERLFIALPLERYSASAIAYIAGLSFYDSRVKSLG